MKFTYIKNALHHIAFGVFFALVCASTAVNGTSYHDAAANFQTAYRKLAAIQQDHLLAYWDTLSPEERSQLTKQVEQLDINSYLYQKALLVSPVKDRQLSLEVFEDFDYAGNKENQAYGNRLIKQGLMGCLIVAGGQGSRLRFEGPKGKFPVTPVMNKSLFQVFTEKLAAASRQAGRPLYLAIMTSPLNHQETVDFFKQHQFFGVDPEQIAFFSQGMLPFLDPAGNLLLETTFNIAEGPNGNGCALEDFYRSGIWEKWYGKGIRYLNFVLIDNPLADPFDAELLGYQARTQSDVVLKCTMRRDAQEKVGVIAKQDGKVTVVEYSEIPQKEKTATLADGSLLFPCANLSLFCFSMDFIRHHTEKKSTEMPLHLVLKEVKYLERAGVALNREKPLAWKYEKYIFDVLGYASKVSALLYKREECFAPLKNFSGEDSLATVQEALQKNDRRILASITGTPISISPIELSQDFYYPTPQLLNAWRGTSITKSGYIRANGYQSWR